MVWTLISATVLLWEEQNYICCGIDYVTYCSDRSLGRVNALSGFDTVHTSGEEICSAVALIFQDRCKIYLQGVVTGEGRMFPM